MSVEIARLQQEVTQHATEKDALNRDVQTLKDSLIEMTRIAQQAKSSLLETQRNADALEQEYLELKRATDHRVKQHENAIKSVSEVRDCACNGLILSFQVNKSLSRRWGDTYQELQRALDDKTRLSTEVNAAIDRYHQLQASLHRIEGSMNVR